MNYNKIYAASTSLLLLAGCSSSGDNATATLAAVAAPPIATPSPSQQTAAGSNAFSNGQAGVVALPVFDPASNNNVQTTNLPVFNSDGSVGRSTVRSSDDGQFSIGFVGSRTNNVQTN